MTAARFPAFDGVHCETVATGTLLLNEGIELSEPMLFGLGEGLSFVFLNLSTLPLPFVGGRVKPFEITRALARNLDLVLDECETSSRKKAWTTLTTALHAGRPVGLQLDCFYLDYFKRAPHFAGHCVAAVGLDDKQVWLADTRAQGGVQRAARANVEQARHARGPMAAKARQWTVAAPKARPDLAVATQAALRATAQGWLNPAFGGASYRGMEKLAASLPSWRESPPDARCLAASLMEGGGTGGALFRNLYRDFLDEAMDLLPNSSKLRTARDAVASSANCWTQIADLVNQSARLDSDKPLHEASALCLQAVKNERVAAEALVAF